MTTCIRCGFNFTGLQCPNCKENKMHPREVVHDSNCHCRLCVCMTDDPPPATFSAHNLTSQAGAGTVTRIGPPPVTMKMLGESDPPPCPHCHGTGRLTTPEPHEWRNPVYDPLRTYYKPNPMSDGDDLAMRAAREICDYKPWHPMERDDWYSLVADIIRRVVVEPKNL